MNKVNFINIASISDEDLRWQKELLRINFSLALSYYAEYYGEKFKDHSFLIVNNGELLGYCICFQIAGQLCFPAEGIRFEFINEKWQAISKLGKQILEYIEQLARENSCDEIVIKENKIQGELSSIGEVLFNNNYKPRLLFDMLVNKHNFNEQQYYAGIRKSYKSLINWGRRELKIEYINKNNLRYDEFANFQNFHQKISGKKTRSDESWNIQYKMLENGFGELILGHYQGNLVAGSLFIDQFDTTVYFTGVYERSLFEYGVSHYLLYEGILRAIMRDGANKVFLGNFDAHITDEKQHNIQFFKKGFCNELAPIILWSKKLQIVGE